MFGKVSVILCLNIVYQAQIADAATLDQALLDDMFVKSSNRCVGSEQTSFNFDFSWSNTTSKWWPPNAPYEKYLFLAEMKHSDNVNRTWKIRIGTGGNIYSYVNTAGEVCYFCFLTAFCR